MNRSEVERLARDYLIENIGNMVGPGEVYFNLETKVWVVPIIYQDLIQRVMIGKLEVDSMTAKVSAPSRAELLINLEREERLGTTLVINIEKLDKNSIEAIKKLGGVKSVECI